MRYLLPRSRLLIVFALTAASGVLAGSASNRWGKPVDLLEAGGKIDELPEQIGNWELLSSEHFDKSVVEMLQCTGNTQRVYQNSETGAVVRMAFFVGPTGPTSVHTPDVCFTGANYEVDQAASEIQIRPRKGPKASLWSGTFRSKDLAGDSLRVIYSWCAGERWTAAKHPRFEFAGSPLLYKLMVVAGINRGVSDQDQEACRDFLENLLPALEPILLKSSD